MTKILKKFDQNLAANGTTAFTVLFLYGIALLFFLFNTVHDRSDEELRKRLDPRWNKAIMVWINHGYIAHGGLPFQNPLEEDPQQEVVRSITMAFMQLAHLLQRIHVTVTGEFGYFLMALHHSFFQCFHRFFSVSLQCVCHCR